MQNKFSKNSYSEIRNKKKRKKINKGKIFIFQYTSLNHKPYYSNFF